MNTTNNNGSKNCACPHHRVNGLLVALAALSFLLGNLEVISMHVVNIIWPVLVMIVGVNKSIARGMCKCCTSP